MRVNPFGVLLADCTVCAEYGVPWGSRCALCGMSKGYPLPRARRGSRPLEPALFVRPAPEPVPERRPHPAPTLPAHEVAPDDPHLPRLPGLKGRPSRPGQPAQIHAAALKAGGWSVSLTHSRGNDLDGKTGEALGVTDAVMIRGQRQACAFAAVWIAGLVHTCAECAKPLRLTSAGIFRVHYLVRGDADACQGSGQRPTTEGAQEWRMEMAYWQRATIPETLAIRPGFTQLKSLILES